MGHPDEMEDQRIGRHANFALSVCPSDKLVSFVFKYGCSKDALFAIADRTGHHAVMAPDTGGKTIQEGTKVFHHPFEFLEGGIPLFRPLSNDFTDHLRPVCRLFPFGQGQNPLLFDLPFKSSPQPQCRSPDPPCSQKV